MPDPAQILIAYASAGAGHQRSAEAIHRALADVLPDTEVPLLDVLDSGAGPVKTLYRRGYRLLVGRFARLYRYLYFKWENDALGRVPWVRARLEPMLFKAFQTTLRRRQPQLVISTHFLATYLAAELKTRRLWRGKLWQVITDYHPHGFQTHAAVDDYIVATAQVRDALDRWGVDPQAVHPVGMPCPPDFHAVRRQSVAARSRTLSPRVLLLAHGVPYRRVEPMARHLAAQPDIELVVAGMASARCRRRLARRLGIGAGRVRVLGVVPGLAQLLGRTDLLVTKAGGLMVSEALAAGVPLAIYHCYPGQEVYNRRYLLENGAAEHVRRHQDVAALARNHRRLADLRAAMTRLARPRAAQRVACMAAAAVAGPEPAN